MTVIICATYKKNPFRTVDATERTRFSKSRPNDLEDIGQGQGSSHPTHPLMLLIICIKYGKNPSWTADATGRTRWVTDRQTDWRTDRQTDGVNPIYPPIYLHNLRLYIIDRAVHPPLYLHNLRLYIIDRAVCKINRYSGFHLSIS